MSFDTIFSAITAFVSVFYEFFHICKHKITITEKTSVYLNQKRTGCFTFNCLDNNGIYRIGKDDYEFDTQWSRCGSQSIYAYNDCKNIDKIGLINNIGDIETDIKLECDFSSRYREAYVGDAIVWININGKKAITKIINVDKHDNKCVNLTCEYMISD